MDRRSFLKRVAGFSLGLAAVGLALPTSAKCKMASPLADLVGANYLDGHIRGNIRRLKQDNPGLKIGETHCHTTFSDGNYSVRDLMRRAANLGLDFLVITEHLMPQRYPVEHSLASIAERWRQYRTWDQNASEPITVYPAFEVSTEQGHLILAFPEDYLKPENRRDLGRRFSCCDKAFVPMETAAKSAKSIGGISIVAHPNISRSYPFGAPTAFIKQHLAGLVDAIEDISAGHGYQENYSEELGLASIGSSDDHFNLIVGTAVTGYDSTRHKDLLSAVRARETRAIKVENSLDDMISAARIFL